MVTGTHLSIQEVFYFIPYYKRPMLSENHLIFVTEIIEVAENFSIKIWKTCKK